MSRIHRRLPLPLAATMCLGIWFTVRADEPQPNKPAAKGKTEVECTVLVARKYGGAELAKGTLAKNFEEDYLATQAALIKSPRIIEQAMRRPGLQDLKSFPQKGAELFDAISDAITVRRESPTSNVLVISIRSDDANDGRLILREILDSYQTFINSAYKSAWDQALEGVTQAHKRLVERREVYEQAYADYARKSSPSIQTSSEIQTALSAVAARKAALLVARSELNARLAWLEKARLDPRNRALILVRANDWATRSGFDKLPDDVRRGSDIVQLYADHLKQEVEENEAIEKSLVQTEQAERIEQQKLAAHELELQRLRERFESANAIQADALKRMLELSLARDQGGYELKLLSPPRQKK